jgi:hypothetical protein
MAVNTPNAIYDENLSRWQVMRDVCAGSLAIKKGGELYLPATCSCADEDGKNNYLAYKDRAVFYPVTKDTLQSHVGLAFSDDPTFEPDGMEFLKDDADGSGKSIYQINQTALEYLLKYGRGGFFVDYPRVEGGVSKADVANGIRPTVVLYDAISIINWRVKKIGGVWKNSLIVLSEKATIIDPQDEFVEKEVKNYRVLRLDDNNEYCQQMYIDIDGAITPQEIVYPLNASGSKWKEIPFIPIGAQSNDFNVDDIPLESLATINLAHYINSASYEKSVYICGEVQPVMTELSEDWRDWLADNGMLLGSDKPLLLPLGAKFDYVSANIEMVAKDAMDAKLEYMNALSSKVLDKSIANKTATQVESEDAKNYSVLSLCVSNLNEASEYYLRWCAEFHGSGNKAKFSIKQDFARGEIGLEMLKFYQSEVVRGAMSDQTFSEIKSTGKKPEIDFDEEQLRIEAEKNGMNVV